MPRFGLPRLPPETRQTACLYWAIRPGQHVSTRNASTATDSGAKPALARRRRADALAPRFRDSCAATGFRARKTA